MSREVHVRFWESVRVKFPHATRLNLLFSDYLKCLDLIFIYLPGMMLPEIFYSLSMPRLER